MYKLQKIAVVVPAYNEEKFICGTIKNIPEYVDHIIVVNDGSSDNTANILLDCSNLDSKIQIITHIKNLGLGASIIDGYKKSLELKSDIAVVMDGDGQMDPGDLKTVIDPIVSGLTDCTKGNRLLVAEVSSVMPKHRLFGNAILTFLTKFATGYWHLMDPQCAYTAISCYALKSIPIEKITKKYGYNASVLTLLNIYNFRACNVKVKPIYGEEKSGIKLRSYIPRLSLSLITMFFARLINKYLIRNFNPLCLSYFTSMILLSLGSIPLLIRLLYMYIKMGPPVPRTTLLCLILVTLAGIQILLSAVQYDMEDNRRLCTDLDLSKIKTME